MSNYHPEPYWSDVAKRIDTRKGQNLIAGDDEPYYRYKRKQFLNLLLEVDFSNQSVLEIGSGPGGNLKAISESQSVPGLRAVDISSDMIALAKKTVPGIDIQKIDGTQLPFETDSINIIFTATVLQHNTNHEMLEKLVKDICRVAEDKIYFFERIESKILGDDLCYGRPVSYYQNLCEQEGFELRSTKFINIRVSYYVCGAIRKFFNKSTRKEGEPLTALSIFLQKVTLPFTKVLDKIFLSKKDVARLEFVRKK